MKELMKPPTRDFNIIFHKQYPFKGVMIQVELKVSEKDGTETMCLNNETEDYKQTYDYSYDISILLERRLVAIHKIEEMVIDKLDRNK